MRKRLVRVGFVLAICASLTMPSCIGSFALTKKMLAWNHTVSSKFVNELVFFAFWILPVYEVSSLADLLVINSIEFWSGTNPVEEAPKTITTENGTYNIVPDNQGYTITNETTGDVVRLDYDRDDRTWSVVADGDKYELLTFVDDTHVALPVAGGKSMVVSLDDAGLMAYREATASKFASPLALR